MECLPPVSSQGKGYKWQNGAYAELDLRLRRFLFFEFIPSEVSKFLKYVPELCSLYSNKAVLRAVFQAA